MGKILNGVEIKLNKKNEINIKTNWMFLGYLNKEEISKDYYFPTGDLGETKGENLYITGRLSDIIIKGGVNISPKRIKEFICKYVNESVILGLKDSFLGERIACFYTGDLNEKSVNSLIIKSLGKDYSIDEFHRLNEIPKNINGKIDKLKLKMEYSK